MSDQPKPTGEFHGIGPTAEHFPPTTGEWTAYQVFEIMGTDNGDDGWKRERLVADAHNAALAAEHKLYLATLTVAETQAKELAAERERTDHWRQYEKLARDQTERWITKNQQLRDQLEADKGVLKPLVDELTRMSFSYLATADELRQMARDALAKVKEGK